MIGPPFTGQTSGRGIIMHYSYEFKIKCIKMYEREESYKIALYNNMN